MGKFLESLIILIFFFSALGGAGMFQMLSLSAIWILIVVVEEKDRMINVLEEKIDELLNQK